MLSRTKGYIAGGMTFAAFTVGGAAFGNEVYYNDVVPFKEETPEIVYSEADLAEAREEQVALDYDRLIIREELGESCLRLVNLYMPDGGLADTPENVIVSDILREPGQPCGDSVAQIRNDVRTLWDAEVDVAESVADYESMIDHNNNNDTEEEEINVPDVIDSQAVNIALFAVLAGMIGAPAGMAANLLTQDITTDTRRRKRK